MDNGLITSALKIFLVSRVVVISRSSCHDADQHDADDESADVGPPRDTAGIGGTGNGKGRGSIKELHHEPKPEYEYCRYLDNLDEDKYGNEDQNLGPRI